MRGQLCGQRSRSVEVNPPAAARPEQEFHNAFDVSVIAGGLRRGLGENLSLEVMHAAVCLFKRNANRQRFAGSADALAESTIGQRGGTELRVQRRRHFWSG